jgi:hypothetical protein
MGENIGEIPEKNTRNNVKRKEKTFGTTFTWRGNNSQRLHGT